MAEVPRLQGKWDNFESSPTEIHFTLNLQDTGWFEGTFFATDTTLHLSTGDLKVAHNRPKGTSTRLMMGAMAFAKDCGATETGALITRPEPLAVRRKIFGNAIAFYGVNMDDPEIDITVDEALLALSGEGKFADKEPFKSEAAVVARSDLTNLDTKGWERPLMHNRPPLYMRRILYKKGISLPLSRSQMQRRGLKQ